jgi:alkyl hydroperoxide reductase subunit F
VCDGPLFGGKEVASIGGGNSALEAILMMTKIASHITAVNKNSAFKGDEIYIQQLSSLPNVEVVYSAATREVKGDGQFASSIVVENTATKETKEYPAKGVFVEIGSIPIIEPVNGLGLEMTAYNEIKVSRNAETNIPGFFAAGDITDIRDKQIVVAAGMGCAAALSAGEYLIKQGAQ